VSRWRALSPAARVLVANGLAFNLGFYMLMPYLAQHLGADLGLAGWITGLVMGLRLDHEQGGPMMTAAGYEVGLWAFFAGFDRSVLQFKPGILINGAECDELLGLVEKTVALCEARLGRA